MSDSSVWLLASGAMVLSGFASFVALFWIDAPYGRFAPEKPSWWGPPLPARWAWFIQESPALVLMLLYACFGSWGDVAHQDATPNRILAAMFIFHYVVRAWIFPFLLSQPKPIPLCVMLMAFAFCVYNGWLQGAYLFTAADSAPHQYPKDWLELWRTRIGIAIFLFGWAANQHADYVLRHLRDNDKARKDGSESETKVGAASDAGTSEAVRRRYKIPYGGLFRWTSAANYTGEIIEWGGWALAANSAPATAFWLFTIFNLAPRAISSHRWYLKHFPNYPKDRKAVIPYLI